MGKSPQWIRLQRADGTALPVRVRYCATFGSRLRGLTFRRQLDPDTALLLVEARDGRANTAIHMFFVFFPIAAIWINDAGEVVDKRLALPFRPYYAAQAPARYVLEGDPQLLDMVEVGETLYLVPEA
ncbi:MAG TPA: hypothetical protein ENN14_00295 [Chloroflexi bacterium]|nr:hypothetical protein [Chloroflexota bacterium]